MRKRDFIMALVKCPECGRDNVSDSAEACPDCGYGIKRHYEEIKKKQEERNKLLEEEYKKQKEARQIDLETRAQYVDIPSHRPIMTAWQVGGAAAIVLGILMIICHSWLFSIVLIGFGAIIIYGEMDNLHSRQKIYDDNINDPDNYRKEMVKQQDFEEMEIQLARNMKTNKNSYGIKCPYCKSGNVKKISTTSRAISVSAIGAASGKIGKQWHCNNCKSDF